MQHSRDLLHQDRPPDARDGASADVRVALKIAGVALSQPERSVCREGTDTAQPASPSSVKVFVKLFDSVYLEVQELR